MEMVALPGKRTKRKWPLALKLLVAAFLAVVLVVLAAVAANAWMIVDARGSHTAVVADVPPAETAIVLGARVMPDGRMSHALYDRVLRGAELYKAGKVDKVLVSGDHGAWRYDESGTMRKAMLEFGIPPEDVFTDHAGFNTRASMIRAREIFGVTDAVVVTQRFHMPRALYLADAAGIDATGLTADMIDWGQGSGSNQMREFGSRLKAIWDNTVNTDVVGGPPIPISGDGRASWGPPPPPGTPPPGSPGR